MPATFPYTNKPASTTPSSVLTPRPRNPRVPPPKEPPPLWTTSRRLTSSTKSTHINFGGPAPPVPTRTSSHPESSDQSPLPLPPSSIYQKFTSSHPAARSSLPVPPTDGRTSSAISEASIFEEPQESRIPHLHQEEEQKPSEHPRRTSKARITPRGPTPPLPHPKSIASASAVNPGGQAASGSDDAGASKTEDPFRKGPIRKLQPVDRSSTPTENRPEKPRENSFNSIKTALGFGEKDRARGLLAEVQELQQSSLGRSSGSKLLESAKELNGEVGDGEETTTEVADTPFGPFPASSSFRKKAFLLSTLFPSSSSPIPSPGSPTSEHSASQPSLNQLSPVDSRFSTTSSNISIEVPEASFSTDRSSYETSRSQVSLSVTESESPPVSRSHSPIQSTSFSAPPLSYRRARNISTPLSISTIDEDTELEARRSFKSVWGAQDPNSNSLKAYAVLAGLNTRSPKAISTLTGIKIGQDVGPHLLAPEDSISEVGGPPKEEDEIDELEESDTDPRQPPLSPETGIGLSNNGASSVTTPKQIRSAVVDSTSRFSYRKISSSTRSALSSNRLSAYSVDTGKSTGYEAEGSLGGDPNEIAEAREVEEEEGERTSQDTAGGRSSSAFQSKMFATSGSQSKSGGRGNRTSTLLSPPITKLRTSSFDGERSRQTSMSGVSVSSMAPSDVSSLGDTPVAPSRSAKSLGRSSSMKVPTEGISSSRSANGSIGNRGSKDSNRRKENPFGPRSSTQDNQQQQQPKPASPRSSSISSQSPPVASLYLVCGLPKDPDHWTLAEPEVSPIHLEHAVRRFWRPEVLGTMVSGDEPEMAMDDLDGASTVGGGAASRDGGRKSGRFGSGPGGSRKSGGRRTGAKSGSGSASASASTTNKLNGNGATKHGSKLGSNGTQPGNVESLLTKEEIAKIQAKAMKLAFTREVEVVASTVAPPSTTHTFSFTIPKSTSSTSTSSGAIGAAWDRALHSASTSVTEETTYYGVTLQVWSHADKTRSDAIRAAVEGGSKAKSMAIARAVKAAAAGRKFGERLESKMNNPMGLIAGNEGFAGKGWNSGADTETETEALVTDSEWETQTVMSQGMAIYASTVPCWLPYCLTLISRYPLYDLMTDYLRVNWARYHLQIGRHSLAMVKLLNMPARRPGDTFKVPVGAPEAETSFVSRLPGKYDLGAGGLLNVDLTMWPVFRALSVDTILTVCEVALSPMGRVVFFSRHAIMLGIAVETFRYLLELRGWKGVCHSVAHARDVRICLEDPGPYLLGLNAQCRPIAADAPPEICIVDLDTDSVECRNPAPGAISYGSVRDRLRKKLQAAIGFEDHLRGIPLELREAFPGGRFRPFSQVEVKGVLTPAERLMPPSGWDWNQDRVVAAFDKILSLNPSSGILSMLFRKRSARRAAELDPSARHIQEIVRRHASSFVDRRDMLEAKLWKMNRRLALLMAESMAWKSHVDIFQNFTSKLTVESTELKTRLEKERREARRLSGVVSEQNLQAQQLQRRLSETEKARKMALDELQRLEQIKKEITKQRDLMAGEIRQIISIDDISADLVEALGRPGTPGTPSPTASPKRLRRMSINSEGSSAPTVVNPVMPGEMSVDGLDDLEDETGSQADGLDVEDGLRAEERFDKQREAVTEKIRSIQERLEQALKHAGQPLEEEEGEPEAKESNENDNSPAPSVDSSEGTAMPSTDSGTTGPPTPKRRSFLIGTATAGLPPHPRNSLDMGPRAPPRLAGSAFPRPTIDRSPISDDAKGSFVGRHRPTASQNSIYADASDEYESATGSPNRSAPRSPMADADRYSDYNSSSGRPSLDDEGQDEAYNPAETITSAKIRPLSLQSTRSVRSNRPESRTSIHYIRSP